MSAYIPLSNYAKFHMLFKGYNFYDNVINSFCYKWELWQYHRHLCLIMLKKEKAVMRYTLYDREGWKNGLKLPKKDDKK